MEKLNENLSNKSEVFSDAEKNIKNDISAVENNLQKELKKEKQEITATAENIKNQAEKNIKNSATATENNQKLNLDIPTIKPEGSYPIAVKHNTQLLEKKHVASSEAPIKKQPNNAELTSNKNQEKNTSKVQETQSQHSKNVKENHTQKNKKQKKSKFVLIVLILLAVIIAICTFIFGLITSKSNKIISGVSVGGVDVSNLTKQEAISKLNNDLVPNLSSELNLSRGEYSTTLSPSAINTEFNIENAVDDAFSAGRSNSNIFSNNFDVISTFFKKKNINAIASYNQDALDNYIINLNKEIPDGAISSSYKIEGTNLIVANSTSGYKINNSELSNSILNSITTNEKNIEIPVEKYEAESVDIEAIYKEIKKDAVDASYTTNPYEIKKEVEGLDFAISLDEAKKIVAEGGESFTIPLKVIKPNVTVRSLPQEAFPDLLGTYSTSYATSNANRKNNIGLAAGSVNGTVLMPGDVFSYNGTVGQRTAARGYKEAGVYVNGEVTTDYGGGICQVSSTLYNATLLSNLEIVARTNHYFQPGYVPSGQDATVSWGAPDFQFKNNRNYPIKLVISANGATITASVYGLKTDDDYTVKIQSYQVGTISPKVEYKDDSSLEKGKTKVLQGGSNGCRTETYKILYKNGTEVSKTLISADTYQPHNQVVARGTAEPKPTPTPTPNTDTNNNTNNNSNTNNTNNSTNTNSSNNTSNTQNTNTQNNTTSANTAETPSVTITY